MNIPSSNAADPDRPGILAEIVAKVLSVGAEEFEVEYKDGHEEICVMRGPIGFGVASLESSSPDAQELRAQLYNGKKKRRKVVVADRHYVLRIEIFDSFGEDAFRVEIVPDKK